MIDWEELTLANGLRVVVVPQPALHRVSFGLFVGVGARHESAADNGISHFLEHMLYRGTKRHPSAHAQNLAFERLGGSLSATTHADHTHLHVIAPPESFGASMELLGEVVRAPRLGEIEVEKRIVREEILDDVDETGRQIDPDNVVRALMFGEHPLGYPITGPIDALEHFNEERLRAHLARYWVAANSVLAVAGNCDVATVKSLAERCFGDMEAGVAAQAPKWDRSFIGKTRRKHVASPGSQTDLRVSWLTPGERDPEGTAIELLLRIIDDGMSTRLYRRLADDGGMVYDCSALWEPFIEVGALDLAATMTPERLPEVAGACVEMIEELATKGPTDVEVDKAKRRHRWSVQAALDHADELEGLAGGAVLFDRTRGLDAQAARFDALTPRDLRDAAKTVFTRERMYIATIGTLTARGRLSLREILQG